MSTRNDHISRLLPAAIFTAATLLVATGAVSVISTLAIFGPAVGDIIAFDPSSDPISAASENVRLTAGRENKASCVLDLDTITHRGGSMVLEARAPGISKGFFLHWAGERTTSDTEDCGRNADLMVDRRDIDILALTAGGYGIDQKTRPLIGGAVPF
jgi:hypothetical protein